jgi:hypothetical protein
MLPLNILCSECYLEVRRFSIDSEFGGSENAQTLLEFAL